MAQKKLARHVTVGTKTYGPNDDVPDEMAAQIRNPKAWVPLDAEVSGDTGDAGREGGTSSGARLATTVTVGARSYGPNDPLSDEVAAQIRNPKAWVGGKVPAAPADGGSGDTKGGAAKPPTGTADMSARKAAAPPPAKRA